MGLVLSLVVTWHPNGLLLYIHWKAETLVLLFRLPREGKEPVLERSVLCWSKTKRRSNLVNCQVLNVQQQGNPFYIKHCTQPGIIVCFACCLKALVRNLRSNPQSEWGLHGFCQTIACQAAVEILQKNTVQWLCDKLKKIPCESIGA